MLRFFLDGADEGDEVLGRDSGEDGVGSGLDVRVVVVTRTTWPAVSALPGKVAGELEGTGSQQFRKGTRT